MNANCEETRRLKGVRASSITLSNEENFIVKKAFIPQIKPSGFHLIFNYRDLVAESLKFQLHLHSLWYKNIHMYIPDMQIELEGTVVSTQHLGKGTFKVNIKFPKTTPKYWRECLSELWPKPAHSDPVKNKGTKAFSFGE